MNDQATHRAGCSAQGGPVAFEDGPAAVRVGGDGLDARTFLVGPSPEAKSGPMTG